MANVAISGDTSGAITLSVPAVAGTNTLTLPAVTGTLLTNKSTGTVLQVVNSTTSSTISSSTTSFTTTGFSGAITPSSTSSRILVQVCLYAYVQGNGSTADMGMNFQIDRNGTKVFNSGANAYPGFYISGYPATRTTDNLRGIVNFTFVDSPSSTSALTYTLFWARYNATSIAINNDLPEISSIILTEIA
jgi:hypothetical protein